MASNRLLHRGGRSVLRSPILKCRPNLRVLPAGGVKGSASARARSREDSFGLFAVNAGQNGGGRPYADAPSAIAHGATERQLRSRGLFRLNQATSGRPRRPNRTKNGNNIIPVSQ